MPVDTSVVARMSRLRKPYYLPIHTTLVETIRKIVINVTGYDPYYEPISRIKEFVIARQLFVFFIRKYVKMTQKATGQLVGKNHATINHAEMCVRKFVLLEKKYRILYDKIEIQIIRTMN